MSNNNTVPTIDEETKKRLELYGSPKSADTQTEQALSDLQKHYSQQSANLAQSRKQEKEDAYVLYQRMQKYMPQYLKSLGMTGLGVSETYASQAMGDYQNNLSSIEQAYRQEQQALDAERYDRESNLLANYATAKEDERMAMAENVYAPKFEQFINGLEAEMEDNGGAVSQESFDEVMAWLETNKNNMPASVYNAYVEQMNEFFDTNSEEIQKEATNAVQSNGFTFYAPDAKTEKEDMQYYRVEVARNMDAITEAAKKLYGEEIPYGTVYAKKTANGKVVYFMYGKTKNGEEGWMRQKGTVKDKTKNSNKRADQIDNE